MAPETCGGADITTTAGDDCTIAPLHQAGTTSGYNVQIGNKGY